MDGYIHNEEEKIYKKIVWEEMNRDYLEVISQAIYIIYLRLDAFWIVTYEINHS